VKKKLKGERKKDEERRRKGELMLCTLHGGNLLRSGLLDPVKAES
jgi:hypothetical protein